MLPPFLSQSTGTKRRIGWLGIAFVVYLAISVSLSFANDRPNIIVVLVDDMGVMDTSVPFLTDSSGQSVRYPLNDFYRTPNMERLAKQGIRFNQFCAMSVCSPTRLSIMTGKNGARHRTTNWIDPDRNNAGPKGPPTWNWRGLTSSDQTLAKILQSAGYRTIHVGKGHFGPSGSEGSDPLKLGFDINVGGTSAGQPASYYGKQNFGNTGGSVLKTDPRAVPGLEKYYGTETFLTDALTLEAKSHIEASVKESRPFFLNFAHYAVHAPFQSDPRFIDHYKESGKSDQANAFASLVEGMDRSMGDLMDHLEKLNVAENTLILFLGDNGSDGPLGDPHQVACAAPLRGKKGSHYEGGMRVPFIAAWGKNNTTNPHQKAYPIAQGAIQTQLAAVYDLFPTILDVAGCSKPRDEAIEGESLTTLMQGRPDPKHRDGFLMHYPHAPHRSDYFTSFRTQDWKVVYHYWPSKGSENARYQLYNLREDPFEQMNLAVSQPDRMRSMMQQMIEALESQKALFPIDESGAEVKPLLP